MTEIIARRQFAPLYIWLAIGVLVQFGWEAGLLLGSIRSFGEKLRTLTVNSLLETNLGVPYVYAIFTAYSAKFTEQLRRRAHPLSFSARIAENNRERPGRARGAS